MAAAPRVEAGGRLVEEEHRRGEDEARGEVETAAHSPGVRLHQPRGGTDEIEALQ
jgi:hypothetical protein